VSDFVSIGSGKDINALAKEIDAKYGVTGLGEVKWILGMKVERDRAERTISMSQEAFFDSILARFNLTDAVPTTTPLRLGT